MIERRKESRGPYLKPVIRYWYGDAGPFESTIAATSYAVVQLLRNGYHRAGDMAAFLGVSDRTVYRAIAHARALGIHIDGAAGVGYRIREKRTCERS